MPALNPYAAVMAFHDIADNGKPQAASFVLGTEKRVEDLFQIFFANAAPIVFNGRPVMVFFLPIR